MEHRTQSAQFLLEIPAMNHAPEYFVRHRGIDCRCRLLRMICPEGGDHMAVVRIIDGLYFGVRLVVNPSCLREDAMELSVSR